jgi:hypothetical protein
MPGAAAKPKSPRDDDALIDPVALRDKQLFSRTKSCDKQLRSISGRTAELTSAVNPLLPVALLRSGHSRRYSISLV